MTIQLAEAPRGMTPPEADLPFLVWRLETDNPSDPKPWKLSASFSRFDDCMEFARATSRNGYEIVFQTPTRGKRVKANRPQAVV
jgi:hypothetical protein